jgi:hypothetical protein
MPRDKQQINRAFPAKTIATTILSIYNIGSSRSLTDIWKYGSGGTQQQQQQQQQRLNENRRHRRTRPRNLIVCAKENCILDKSDINVNP